MRYLVVYQLIRKTTKYSMAPRVNRLILFLWNLHGNWFMQLVLMPMVAKKITYFKRNKTGHYCLIESAIWNFLMFRFHDLMCLANNLFIKEGRPNLMSELREKTFCKYYHRWSGWENFKPSHCSKNLFETSMCRIFSNGSLQIKNTFQQLTPGC